MARPQCDTPLVICFIYIPLVTKISSVITQPLVGSYYNGLTRGLIYNCANDTRALSSHWSHITWWAKVHDGRDMGKGFFFLKNSFTMNFKKFHPCWLMLFEFQNFLFDPNNTHSLVIYIFFFKFIFLINKSWKS
jgi:hypothetical protein